MEIKDIIKGLRKLDDVTAFSKASGVSRATLYRVAEGWANPTIKTLQKIEAQLLKQSKERQA